MFINRASEIRVRRYHEKWFVFFAAYLITLKRDYIHVSKNDKNDSFVFKRRVFGT